MISVGIDIGNTIARISHVDVHNVPYVIPDSYDADLFGSPCMAHIGDHGVLIGAACADLLEIEPNLPVIDSLKWKLAAERSVYRDHTGKFWSPEEVVGFVIRKLLNDAEAFTGDRVGKSVLTTPARFGQARRQGLLEAARVAGLKKPQLIDAPIAAAVFHCVEEFENAKTALVYDLGATGFEVSLLMRGAGGFIIGAVEGDQELGSRNFEDVIIQAALDQSRDTKKSRSSMDKSSTGRLRKFAEKAKILFSRSETEDIEEAILLSNRIIDFTMTRAQYEMRIRPIIQQTLQLTAQCVQSASASLRSVDCIIMTGGGSLTPLTRAMLIDASQKSPDTVLCQKPHHSVGFGAALIAQGCPMPGSGLQRAELMPVDLAMAVRDAAGKPSLSIIIPRGAILPAVYSAPFFTNSDTQTRIALDLACRKRLDQAPMKFGHFSFGPIDTPRAKYRIDVEITCDKEGIVRAVARDPVTGKSSDAVLGDVFALSTPDAPGSQKLLGS